MSLYSVVSRGVVGRFVQRPGEAGASAEQASPKTLGVRLPGASMKVLETGLALTAIATAILIGAGR